jgi:polar amino acid transport system substrate-binding protein
MLSLAALLLLPTAAGAAPTLVAAGKLTYGVAASFAPFEYQQDGKDVGFDIAFGAAVARHMGLKPTPLDIDFGGLIPALQGHRIDIVNSAMYINPARAQLVDFVPYMTVAEEVVVKHGNPLKITGHDDLCGDRVAVTLGAIEETYAKQDAATCQAAGKPALTILTLPTGQDSILALRQGRADAFYDSTPGVAAALKALPGVFTVAGPTFGAGTEIGIAVRKGDTAMHDAVAAGVQAAVKDGTYARLLKKYDLPASGSIF